MRMWLVLAAALFLGAGHAPDALAAQQTQPGFDLAQATGAEMALPDSDRTAIRQVIERQLQAFQRDDGAAAFSYAAPGIQSKFENAETFMDMVRQGYQAVYRPRAVQFKDIISLEGTPAQRIIVVGPDGVPMIAVYPMRRMLDGSWRIDGCVLVPFRQSDT
jgi:hypothetical protein